MDSSYCTASAIGHALIRGYSTRRSSFGVYRGVGKEYRRFEAVLGTTRMFQVAGGRKKDLLLWLLKFISFYGPWTSLAPLHQASPTSIARSNSSSLVHSPLFIFQLEKRPTRTKKDRGLPPSLPWCFLMLLLRTRSPSSNNCRDRLPAADTMDPLTSSWKPSAGWEPSQAHLQVNWVSCWQSNLSALLASSKTD